MGCAVSSSTSDDINNNNAVVVTAAHPCLSETTTKKKNEVVFGGTKKNKQSMVGQQVSPSINNNIKNTTSKLNEKSTSFKDVGTLPLTSTFPPLQQKPIPSLANNKKQRKESIFTSVLTDQERKAAAQLPRSRNSSDAAHSDLTVFGGTRRRTSLCLETDDRLRPVGGGFVPLGSSVACTPTNNHGTSARRRMSVAASMLSTPHVTFSDRASLASTLLIDSASTPRSPARGGGVEGFAFTPPMYPFFYEGDGSSGCVITHIPSIQLNNDDDDDGDSCVCGSVAKHSQNADYEEMVTQKGVGGMGGGGELTSVLKLRPLSSENQEDSPPNLSTRTRANDDSSMGSSCCNLLVSMTDDNRSSTLMPNDGSDAAMMW